MKILITGKNRSGKTTLLTKLLAAVPNKQGFLTKEVRDDIDRIGFDLVDQSGRPIVLARTNLPTDTAVGRYFVDVAALDQYLASVPDVQPGQVLYIDEIGQMQLYSKQFKKLVLRYLDATNFFIGTITSIYKDDFVEQINQHPGILTCEITPDNRQELEAGLSKAVEHRAMLDGFDAITQQTIVEMATAYLEAEEYVYFKKLFKNAVPYLAEGRLQPQPDGSYFLRGNTNHHHVQPTETGSLACDCDLFHGRGQFEGQQGLCSHIQTVTLFTLAQNRKPE